MATGKCGTNFQGWKMWELDTAMAHLDTALIGHTSYR